MTCYLSRFQSYPDCGWTEGRGAKETSQVSQQFWNSLVIKWTPQWLCPIKKKKIFIRLISSAKQRKTLWTFFWFASRWQCGPTYNNTGDNISVCLKSTAKRDVTVKAYSSLPVSCWAGEEAGFCNAFKQSILIRSYFRSPSPGTLKEWKSFRVCLWCPCTLSQTNLFPLFLTVIKRRTSHTD